MAVDKIGNAVTSSHPTASVATWRATFVDVAGCQPVASCVIEHIYVLAKSDAGSPPVPDARILCDRLHLSGAVNTALDAVRQGDLGARGSAAADQRHWSGHEVRRALELYERLGSRRFLMGEQQTLLDWRLFTTLIRFDAVYHGHFKCNIRRIVDFPNLYDYLRDLYATPGVAETVNMDHIKRHYYVTHRSINPSGIVPVGPEQDPSAPQDRARRFVASA